VAYSSSPYWTVPLADPDGLNDDPTCRPAPGSDVYSVKKRDAGIFG